MKFRFLRGSYEESMKSVVEVSGMQGLEVILRFMGHTGEIDVSPHGHTDSRNGWDTHYVTVDGNIVGMCNGYPLPGVYTTSSSRFVYPDAQAALEKIESLLPRTFFADRDVVFRVERLVDSWRRAVKALNAEETIE
jgi:hypothetical protein